MTQQNHDSVHAETQRVAMIGSYVPRQCGIATFTKDLRDALMRNHNDLSTLVVALDDTPKGYPYPPEVRLQLRAAQKRDYRMAADLLNINNVDVVFLQHEFGIYGGPDGSHIQNLISRLRMPLITTLHTVLTDPTPGQATAMADIIAQSDRLVVMSHKAFDILEHTYKAPREKIAYIPHGIPDVPFVDTAYHKDQFGFEGRTVLLTFGLLSPGKGIEVAIKALPEIVKKHPEALYVILGATHPHILKMQGNAYRDSLEQLIEKLDVKENVTFHNRYVSLEELCGYIGAADIYVTSYLNEAQITSGTLAYALGAGKAVVSTPFWYAQELLDEGRGRLFPFNDHGALADTVNELLHNPVQRDAMRKKAYMYGRDMVWNAVGAHYLNLARSVMEDWKQKPRTSAFLHDRHGDVEGIPDIKLTHLQMLTDDTGISQHAVFSVPDRFHGYCVDDNARALIAALMHYDLYHDETMLPLINTYLAFMHHAYNPENRRFRNFMNYDRSWVEEAGSEDAHARALWALGVATALAPTQTLLSFVTRFFHRALAAIEEFRSPRAWAFSLIGMHAYLRRYDGDAQVRRIREKFAKQLHEAFAHGSEEWPWGEDVLAYANAKLPHALILSGQWIPDAAMVEQGLLSLEWLYKLQTNKDGAISLIGNQGWMTRDGTRAYFDQQPIEAMSLVEACAEAFRCTQDMMWRKRAQNCLKWFLGHNDTQSDLYDYHTGGCRDGLHPDGPNLNQGAESTLAWLISLLTIQDLTRSAIVADASRKRVVEAGEKSAVN